MAKPTTPTLPVESDSVRTTIVRTEHVTPDAPWHTKEKLAKLEANSETIWADMDDEHRDALAIIITDVLKRMVEDPEVWLPVSLVPVTGNKLDIWIGINLDEMDEEVVRKRRDVKLEHIKIREDLELIKGELATSPTPS